MSGVEWTVLKEGDPYHEHRWQGVSIDTMPPIETDWCECGRTGGYRMSGEDQRHTNHEEQVELVVSRVILPDGRIVETTTTDPPENPPNVIRGNNEGL